MEAVGGVTGVAGGVAGSAVSVLQAVAQLTTLISPGTIKRVFEFVQFVLSPTMVNYLVMSTVGVVAIWLSCKCPDNILGQLVTILLLVSSFVEVTRLGYPFLEAFGKLFAMSLVSNQLVGNRYDVIFWSIFVALSVVGIAAKVVIIVPIFIAARLYITHHIRKCKQAGQQNLADLNPINAMGVPLEMAEKLTAPIKDLASTIPDTLPSIPEASDLIPTKAPLPTVEPEKCVEAVTGVLNSVPSVPSLPTNPLSSSGGPEESENKPNIGENLRPRLPAPTSLF